jgi:hydroxypyruvate isomerase
VPRLAVNLGMLFADRPLTARIGAAAAAGFRAIEFQVPYAVPASDLRAEIDRHSMKVLGINTASGREGEAGLAAVPGREQDFAAQFRQSLDYAVAIGGSAIHCMAGNVPVDRRPAAEKVFVANLRHAAPLAAEKNITLLIEPLNLRDRPDYFLTRAEQAVAIIDQIAMPNVKMQFDFYHMQISGGDLLHRFEKLLPWIGHVQIAAVPSRAEPDEGEVNYPAILAAIDRLGYTGYVAGEYKPRGRTEEGLAWAQQYGVVPRAS